MPDIKRALLVTLIITLTLFMFGCLEKASNEGNLTDNDQVIEEAAATQPLQVEVPDGKTDRLPGSLKWDSITIYAEGIDFISDQPEGLLTQVSSTQTITVDSTTTTETTETAVVTEESETANQGSGGSTTSIHSSSGGITTDITVDGSIKVTESTTSTSGSQSTTNWWEVDATN